MKMIYSLSKLSAYVATGVLGLMMLLTVADVSLRYLFLAPITGVAEMTELMMVIVVFLALPWCAIKGAHIKVDLLVSNFSPRVQSIIDRITLLLVLGIFVVITWRSFLESLQVERITALLRVPQSPFYWILTLGLALFCLAIVFLFVEETKEKEVKK